MNENDEIEIDLLDMCKYFLSKCLIIIAAVIICGGAAFGFSKVKNTKLYTATTQIYVTVPKTSDKVLIRDNANELIQDYMALLKTDLISDKAAKKANISSDKVKIEVEQVEGARIIKLMVTDSDPNSTMKISKAVLDTTMETVTKTLKKDKPVILEQSKKPEIKDSMNIKKNTVVGAAAGFILSLGILFIIYLIRYSKKDYKTGMTHAKNKNDLL